MKDVEFYVDENDDVHLVSVEQVKHIKGDFVPSIWKELKEYVLNKWSIIEGDNESIIRADHEFKFLLGLYDYLKDGYESEELLYFTHGMSLKNFTYRNYVEVLNIPNKVLERNIYNYYRSHIEEYLKS